MLGTHSSVAWVCSSSAVETRSPILASSASPSSFWARLRPTWCHMRAASSGYFSMAAFIALFDKPSATTVVTARAEAALGLPVMSDCSPMT